MIADSQDSSLSAAQRAVLGLLRGYKVAISPYFAGACRYVPSCSEYAADAVAAHGVLKGSVLALRRLGRCHPFGGHGLDVVPRGRPQL